jgi:hypothetical protein
MQLTCSAPGHVIYLQRYRKRIFVQTCLKDNTVYHHLWWRLNIDLGTGLSHAGVGKCHLMSTILLLPHRHVNATHQLAVCLVTKAASSKRKGTVPPKDK